MIHLLGREVLHLAAELSPDCSALWYLDQVDLYDEVGDLHVANLNGADAPDVTLVDSGVYHGGLLPGFYNYNGVPSECLSARLSEAVLFLDDLELSEPLVECVQFTADSGALTYFWADDTAESYQLWLYQTDDSSTDPLGLDVYPSSLRHAADGASVTFIEEYYPGAVTTGVADPPPTGPQLMIANTSTAALTRLVDDYRYGRAGYVYDPTGGLLAYNSALSIDSLLTLTLQDVAGGSDTTVTTRLPDWDCRSSLDRANDRPGERCTFQFSPLGNWLLYVDGGDMLTPPAIRLYDTNDGSDDILYDDWLAELIVRFAPDDSGFLFLGAPSGEVIGTGEHGTVTAAFEIWNLSGGVVGSNRLVTLVGPIGREAFRFLPDSASFVVNGWIPDENQLRPVWYSVSDLSNVDTDIQLSEWLLDIEMSPQGDAFALRTGSDLWLFRSGDSTGDAINLGDTFYSHYSQFSADGDDLLVRQDYDLNAFATVADTLGGALDLWDVGAGSFVRLANNSVAASFSLTGTSVLFIEMVLPPDVRLRNLLYDDDDTTPDPTLEDILGVIDDSSFHAHVVDLGDGELRTLDHDIAWFLGNAVLTANTLGYALHTDIHGDRAGLQLANVP